MTDFFEYFILGILVGWIFHIGDISYWGFYGAQTEIGRWIFHIGDSHRLEMILNFD